MMSYVIAWEAIPIRIRRNEQFDDPKVCPHLCAPAKEMVSVRERLPELKELVAEITRLRDALEWGVRSYIHDERERERAGNMREAMHCGCRCLKQDALGTLKSKTFTNIWTRYTPRMNVDQRYMRLQFSIVVMRLMGTIICWGCNYTKPFARITISNWLFVYKETCSQEKRGGPFHTE